MAFRSIQFAKQLQQKAEEARRNKELAEAGMAEAAAAINCGKKLEVMMTDAEELLAAAKAAFDRKDYVAAISYATQSKEVAKRLQNEKVSGLIKSSENLIMLTKKIGVDTSKAEEFLQKAINALNIEDYEKAVDYSHQTWRENEKVLREHLAKTFTNVQALIVFAKNCGIAVEKVEARLKEARIAADADNYEDALNQTHECVEAIGADISAMVRKMVEDTKTAFEFLAEKDIVQLKPTFDNVEAFLSERKYEEAYNKAKQAKVEVESVVKTRAAEEINKIEKILESAKKVADVSKAIADIEEAKKSLKNNDYRTVFEAVNRAREGCESAQFQIVLKTISDARGDFILAKKIGADISGAVELLDGAREALKSNDYERALQLAEKSKNFVKNIVKEFQEAAAEIKNLHETLASIESLGVDAADVKMNLESAKSALAKRDFKQALKFVEKARSLVDKAQYDAAMQAIDSAALLTPLAEKTGVELDSVKSTLEIAINALKTKNYAKAIESAKAYKAKAEGLIQEKIVEAIHDAEASVKLVERDFDTTDSKRLIEDAKAYLEKKDYEKAYLLTIESRDLIDVVQAKEAEKVFEYVKECVKNVRELGGDVKAAEEILAKASLEFDSKRYPKVVELTDKALSELETAERKLAEDLFFAAKLAVIEIKKIGMDITDLRELLRNAKTAIESGDYRNALKFASQSKSEAEARKKDYDDAYEIMSTAAALIAEGKKINIDVSRCIEKLLAARSAFEKTDYKKALTYAIESKDEARRLISRYTSAKKIVATEEKFATAEKLGVDVTKIREDLAKVQTYVKGGDFVAAEELIDKCDTELDDALITSISFTISSAEAMLSAAKDKNIETGKVEQLITIAKLAIANKSFEEASTYAKTARSELMKITETSQRAAEELKKAEKALADAETLHFDVATAKNLYTQAEIAYKNNDFSMALEFAVKCTDEIDRIERRTVFGIVANLQARIDKAVVKGIDISMPQKYLTDAKGALDKADYRTAIKLTAESQTELERLEMQEEMASKSIRSAQSKIIEAEREGVFVKKATELLDEAKALAMKGDFSKALQVAIQCGNVLYTTREKHREATNIIKSVENRLTHAKSVGIDITSLQKIFEDAKNAYNSHDYENTVKICMSCLETMKETFRTHLTTRLGSLKKSIDICKSVGLDTAKAESLAAACAEEIEKNEYEKALANSKELVAETAKLTAKASPKLLISVHLSKQPFAEEWCNAELTITNAGKTSATKVEVQLIGNFETDKIPTPFEIKGNDMERVPIRLKFKSAGENTITTKVTAGRIFDEKIRVFEDLKKVIVAAPEKLPPKIPVAAPAPVVVPEEKVETCPFCTGKLKPMQEILICMCGKVYHQLCAINTKTCSSCSTDLEPLLGEQLDLILTNIEKLTNVCKNADLDIAEIESSVTSIKKAVENKDIQKALGYARVVVPVLDKMLKRASPRLTVKVLPPTTAKVDEECKLDLLVTNIGKSSAENINCELSGDATYEKITPIEILKAGETATIPVKLIPKKAGKLLMSTKITLSRPFDKKSYSFDTPFEFDVAEKIVEVPIAPTIGPEDKCVVCMGRIKNIPATACKCGRIYHKLCAQRVGECENCKFKFRPLPPPPPPPPPPPRKKKHII